MEGSLALARVARAGGIDTLVATPHVSARYANDPDKIATAVAELNARLQRERIDVRVLAGAEIAITHVPELDPALFPRFGLGGGPWLLVEPPFAAVAPGLGQMLFDLHDQGHEIVLAHPERCPAFHRDRRLLESLVDAGLLLSITAGSLSGRFGAEVRRFALGLARDGLIHNVTSDAHDSEDRPPGLTRELDQAGLAPLAPWLTRAVPQAIIAGTQIPPRPEVELASSAPRWRAWHSRR